MIVNLRQSPDWPPYGPIQRETIIKSGLLNRFRRWRRRQQAVEALRGMPDYLLKDIGISRVEIGFQITTDLR